MTISTIFGKITYDIVTDKQKKIKHPKDVIINNNMNDLTMFLTYWQKLIEAEAKEVKMPKGKEEEDPKELEEANSRRKRPK